MIAHEKAAGMLDTSGAAQETNQHRESTPDQKQLATLIAQFAIAGHTVTCGTNNDYFVGKWGLIRHCPDYAALVVFAQQIGAES